MAKRIVVDPITRIEGHLRIEAVIDGGKIVDAWSSSTAFRGIEKILKGRDPRDAHHFTQRFCGVCTTVHSMASIRAVEDALNIQIPDNARLIRNIIMGIQNVQDHVIHFYHLHALDWVDIVSALSADPAATAKLAQSISNWPKSSVTYFKGIQDKVAAFVGTGRLGPFQNAYWGHSAYKLPPEANLMALAHYLEALEVQKDIIKVHAILGSKNPHPQTFLVGGMTIPVDPDSQNAINADKIAHTRTLLRKARAFVEQVYIPDLLAVAASYLDWASIGGGVGNYLSYATSRWTTAPAPVASSCRVVSSWARIWPMLWRWMRRRSPNMSLTPGTTTLGATIRGCILTMARPTTITPVRSLPTSFSIPMASIPGSSHHVTWISRWRSVRWRASWLLMPPV